MKKKTRQKKHPRRYTALHESRHAIVAIAQGHSVEKVSIIPRPGADGTCFTGIRYAPLNAMQRLQFLARALAGVEAERRESRVARSWLEISAGGDDYRNARAVLEQVHGDFDHLIKEEIEEARRWALDILKRHWAAVDALQEKGEIEGEEAGCLALAASPPLADEKDKLPTGWSTL